MTLMCNISLISNRVWHRSTRTYHELPTGKRSGNGVSIYILIWIRPVLPAHNQYRMENRKIIFIGDWTESLSVADRVCSTGSKTISFWSWYQQKSDKLTLCPICSALLQYSFPEFVYFYIPRVLVTPLFKYESYYWLAMGALSVPMQIHNGQTNNNKYLTISSFGVRLILFWLSWCGLSR